jgi:hypothetical protein
MKTTKQAKVISINRPLKSTKEFANNNSELLKAFIREVRKVASR